MIPKGKAMPQGAFSEAVTRDFGSLDKLKEEFAKVAIGHFGSGWAWLVHDPKENKLKVFYRYQDYADIDEVSGHVLGFGYAFEF